MRDIIARSVTFAVGLDREQAINYLGNSQTGYYRSTWPTVPEAVEYFLGDDDVVLAISLLFDADVRVRSEHVSSKFGSYYADIVEASVRQTLSAIELTVRQQEILFCQSITSNKILGSRRQSRGNALGASQRNLERWQCQYR